MLRFCCRARVPNITGEAKDDLEADEVKDAIQGRKLLEAIDNCYTTDRIELRRAFLMYLQDFLC